MNLKQAVTLILYCITKIVSSQNQPHIVLILADDVGWNDVSFHGSNQIPTPNIDALAYNGVILNRFYTLPTCTPSRSALLTGQYPIRFGLQGIPITAGQNRYLPLDVPTLPEKLKELGYSTNLIGKWHLGSAYKNQTPTSRGFDYHFGYWHGYIGYFNHYAKGNEMIGLDMHDKFDPMWQTQGEYATDLLTKKAEEIISTHNNSKPLFLMVSHLAAHTGNNGEDLEVPNITKNNKDFGYIADEKRRLFAGIMKELDKSVGKTVDALSKKQMLDNTLIIFLSDNGAQTVGLQENRGSNWPLRGLKFSLHDGGVRNIAVVYSSKIQNKGIINELIHITDLMPTIYSAAGGNINNLGKIDGINQWPILISNQKSNRTELLLNIDDLENSSGLIGGNGRYKLINGSTAYHHSYESFYGEDGRDGYNPSYDTHSVLHSLTNTAIEGKLTHDKIKQLRTEADLGNCRSLNHEYTSCTYNNFCLFDLLKDPCETTNIAENNLQIVAGLKKKLEGYWRQLKPQKIAVVDPKANPRYYNNTWYTWLEDDYAAR